MYEVVAENAPSAFHETMWFMRAVTSAEEDTRNGAAYALQRPFFLTIYNPTHRVIACPVRNANPFFHVMETVWMFAGERDIAWLKRFNKNIEQYANDGVVNGAYGHRWFKHWGNQLFMVMRAFERDKNSRQAVIAMWDPLLDNIPRWNDRPCNTHIYFRNRDGLLDMTVCNRSNDLVWGMFGANVVHMTYLQELTATAMGMKLGNYQVFTNNLHFYKDLYPNGHDIWTNILEGPNPYPCETFPVLDFPKRLPSFLQDCALFVRGEFEKIDAPWLRHVALPMYNAYLGEDRDTRFKHAHLVADKAWRDNATAWLERVYERKEHRSGGPGRDAGKRRPPSAPPVPERKA